ncbi:MAG TPA: MarR family transcriptional regulator [Spirochaetales bacterium]|nr:MarR family transcriptional regulator [Spirochaetales bacterium]
MPSPDETERTRQVAERLFEAFRAVAPFKRRPGFGHSARPGEFQLLHRLAREAEGSGVRTGDLAAWLGVKPPTVSQLVDALESRGLAERFADSVDRRATLVRLSAEGRALAASFHERAMAESEALVDWLGLEDGARLAELLARTAAFLEARHGKACACRGHGGDSDGDGCRGGDGGGDQDQSRGGDGRDSDGARDSDSGQGKD